MDGSEHRRDRLPFHAFQVGEESPGDPRNTFGVACAQQILAMAELSDSEREIPREPAPRRQCRVHTAREAAEEAVTVLDSWRCWATACVCSMSIRNSKSCSTERTRCARLPVSSRPGSGNELAMLVIARGRLIRSQARLQIPDEDG